ncbi:MAG: hypothetical protein LBG52_02920 [Candidatus Peribacteria bacterium]|nr:hypothetical protein [Candidatus Peribacteria bacterium]
MMKKTRVFQRGMGCIGVSVLGIFVLWISDGPFFVGEKEMMVYGEVVEDEESSENEEPSENAQLSEDVEPSEDTQPSENAEPSENEQPSEDAEQNVVWVKPIEHPIEEKAV